MKPYMVALITLSVVALSIPFGWSQSSVIHPATGKGVNTRSAKGASRVLTPRSISSKRDYLSQLAPARSSDFEFLRHSWLGFTREGEALYVLDKVFEGQCIWFNPRTKRLRRSATFGSYQADQFGLSADGSVLFATENAGILNRPITKIHYPNFFELNPRTLKRLKTFDVGKETNAYRPHPFPVGEGKLAVPVLESTWDAQLKAFAGDYNRGARIEIWNWKTGKRERAIKYAHAPGMAEMFFSPTQRYICCVFMQDVPDDAGHIDRFVDAGDSLVDVLDSRTGKILWHIEEADHPISYPFFFLSPNQFVAHNMVYDLKNKKSRPLFQPSKTEPRLRCVGGVEGQTNRAFFQTKGGLELWNTRSNHSLHRWPDVKHAQQVTLSPDKRTLAIENKKVFQFWRFDPKWLR